LLVRGDGEVREGRIELFLFERLGAFARELATNATIPDFGGYHGDDSLPRRSLPRCSAISMLIRRIDRRWRSMVLKDPRASPILLSAK
jgi:hypothetical protein